MFEEIPSIFVSLRSFSINSVKMSEQLMPIPTLYINNLNDRLPKEQLRRSLYMLFSQFGIVLDVVALKTERMRGQAWVSFLTPQNATDAMNSLQGFDFYGKPMVLFLIFRVMFSGSPTRRLNLMQLSALRRL